MKTRQYLKVIVLIAFSFFLTNAINAQSDEVKAVFNAKFPTLAESVRAQTLSGEVDAAKTQELRDLYNNLDAGLQDMSSFKINPSDPILVFFDKKELKSKMFKKEPQQAHDELVAMMQKARFDIRDFMADKTQYGIDPRASQKNISLFIEFNKQENFKEAYKPWTYCFLYSPRAHKAIYTSGESVIQGLIEQETNPTRKEELIDTLMLLFDQRIKYFGQEGYVDGRKAVNMLKFRPTAIIEAHHLLAKSIELEGIESSPAVLLVYMQTTSELFKRETKDASDKVIVDAGSVITIYNQLNDLITKALDKTTNTNDVKDLKEAQKGIEYHFANSGAANCDALIAINQAKFNIEANKHDTTFLMGALNMLNRANCDDSELHFEISKQLFSLQPSAIAAGGIATRYLKLKDFDNAIKYYNISLQTCKNPENQAKFNYQMALAYNELGQFSQARVYALKTLSIKPDFGLAYILIATMYAESRANCGETDFDKNTVYWIAVDMLQKAKAADPSITEKANSLIYSYTARFPNKEEAFMHSVTPGKSITVGCWIQGTTTARFN
jgi:tetratricopeptide (TPR) repeat protein